MDIKKTCGNVFYVNRILFNCRGWEKWFTGENNVGIHRYEQLKYPCHTANGLLLAGAMLFETIDLRCWIAFWFFRAWWMATQHTIAPQSPIAPYTAQLLQMACSNNCLAFSNIVRPMNNLVLVLVHVHLVLLLLSCEWFACISINVHFIYAFQFSIISNPSLVISSSDRSASHILPTYRLCKSWKRLQSFSHWANNYSDRQKHSAFASKQWLLSSSSFYGALFLLLGMLVLSAFAI